MTDATSARNYNFRPDDYSTPKVKTGEDGSYKLTDYQAALTVRSWMHQNMPGQMINGATLREVLDQKGPGPAHINVNGKAITLSEQERAAFKKFADENSALFRRLDGGENGTHDHYMGSWDIDAAIKNGRLHGTAQHSPEGYWRNRNDEMPPAKAGDVLNDFFSRTLGNDWSPTHNDLTSIANAHGMWTNTKDGKKFMPIDDPDVTRAAGVLLDNWGNVQIGEGNSVGILSKEELQKLMLL